MADKRVSDFTAATSVSDADLFLIEQSGKARNVTAALLKTVFGGGNGGNGGGVSVDTTLSVEGAAADAKATGDAIAALKVEVAKADYTNWADGSFTFTMSDGTKYPGTVTFDSNNNPTSITINGHTLALTFPE